MAISIRSLLDPDPDNLAKGDTIKANVALGDLRGSFPTASADSIFGALGYPVNPIVLDSGMAATHGGEFDFKNRRVHLSMPMVMLAAEVAALQAIQNGPSSGRSKRARENFAGSFVSDVIAHEMAHEASLDEEGEFSARDPQMAGLLNSFFTRYADLPMTTRGEMYAEYAQRPVSDVMRTFRDDEIQRSEIFAEAVERGYGIARRFDPQDPSKISADIAEADAAFPGTREAVNFWVRSFLGR